ncbi:ankyrin repeat domain-containing protein [Bacillus mycoides]|uniref:ankyrin repeat domain-containing protein n=1 Tax=Bacillus mycoides TaxID=1405 RepID=UPI002E09B38A|nr:ankyrin repeat domain-containing protein [Bacillus mycoides]MEC5267095.1 ankyrin repeat domain-containing protein [Bacillus mycoides]
MFEEKIVNREIRNAIKIGDINKVKQLIGNDTKIINTKTSFGTWLHIAAKKGNLDIVKFLVQEGIDIDARGGTFDSSALNLAAYIKNHKSFIWNLYHQKMAN